MKKIPVQQLLNNEEMINSNLPDILKTLKTHPADMCWLELHCDGSSSIQLEGIDDKIRYLYEFHNLEELQITLENLAKYSKL